jgi:hypothetical protein
MGVKRRRVLPNRFLDGVPTRQVPADVQGWTDGDNGRAYGIAGRENRQQRCPGLVSEIRRPGSQGKTSIEARDRDWPPWVFHRSNRCDLIVAKARLESPKCRPSQRRHPTNRRRMSNHPDAGLTIFRFGDRSKP